MCLWMTLFSPKKCGSSGLKKNDGFVKNATRIWKGEVNKMAVVKLYTVRKNPKYQSGDVMEVYACNKYRGYMLACDDRVEFYGYVLGRFRCIRIYSDMIRN